MKYEELKDTHNSKVYVIQELPGTRSGTPKFNIMGASRYGEIITLLPENSQIIMSPGPLIFKLRKLLKNFTEKDTLNKLDNPIIEKKDFKDVQTKLNRDFGGYPLNPILQ